MEEFLIPTSESLDILTSEITLDHFQTLLDLTEQNYATNYLILVFIVALTICLIIYSVLKKFI